MMKRWIMTAMALAAGLAVAKVESHWDGGRNTPVHRLALNDEFGDPIVPGVQGALPVSTKQTCGQCHDYAAIASGWHFNMADADAKSGRPAQPWFLIDAASGSQIPMGLRGWPGLYKPGQLGMSNWEFIYAFGRHMPGGSIADPEDIYAEGGPNARWIVSGPVEINCFACHSTDKEYDHSEWVRLISRQNFRWATTGALGLGEVGGMGSRVDDYWGLSRGLNPDDAIFKVPPHMKYNVSKFDAKNRTVLQLGKPRNENCLSCHSTTQAGMEAKDIDGDVHLRAGMTCSDCHGNGLDHATARGFLGDNTGAMDKVRATASCAGCHNGTGNFKAGRFGAPAPKHIGMPAVHFEKLNCTVCHSGVTENGELAQVRTSRANRMGVYGRARWATPQPFILEPVFVKDAAGKITPSRMAWPAFWATRDATDNGKLVPVLPETVMTVCQGILTVREQVGEVLMGLGRDPNIVNRPVVIVDGVALGANVDDVAVPVAKTDLPNGVYYKTPTNFVFVLPEFAPDTIIADQDPVKNLLQTMDAIPVAATKGFGAVQLGNQVYYRGGESDGIIAYQAKETATMPVLGWFDAQNNQFSPLFDDVVLKRALTLAGTDYSLTEEMLADALKCLSDSGVERPVYVAHGQVWSLGADGKLSSKEDKVAAPVSWAVGHDVRPARLARGAKPVKCADCHTVGSKFFFGNVESTGPLLTAKKMVKTQGEFMGVSGSYNKLFGTTFLMRPMFKIFLWVVFAFVCLVAVAFTAAAIPSILMCHEAYATYGKRNAKLMEMVDKFSAIGMALAVLYLACSGILGWFFHLMTGYILIFHMVAGGLFAVCLIALIWLRGKKRIKTKRSVLWMLMLVLGACVLFTAVAPMMTIFGEGWQLVLLKGHRCATMCFVAVSLWMLISGGRKD